MLLEQEVPEALQLGELLSGGGAQIQQPLRLFGQRHRKDVLSEAAGKDPGEEVDMAVVLRLLHRSQERQLLPDRLVFCGDIETVDPVYRRLLGFDDYSKFLQIA